MIEAHFREIVRTQRERSMWPALPYFLVGMAQVWGIVLGWFLLRPIIGIYPTFLLIFLLAVGWIYWGAQQNRGLAQRLQARLSSAVGRPSACSVCDYDLRQITSERCPECGSPVYIPPVGAVATDALMLATKLSRTNYFHVKLEPFHPTVAEGIRSHIEGRNAIDIDGGTRLVLFLLAIVSVPIVCGLLVFAPSWSSAVVAVATLVVVIVLPWTHSRWHHRRLLRKYLNRDTPLPCWFCGEHEDATPCSKCGARNVTRDEVPNSAV